MVCYHQKIIRRTLGLTSVVSLTQPCFSSLSLAKVNEMSGSLREATS